MFGTSADPQLLDMKKFWKVSKIYSYTFTYASDNPQKKHKEDIAVQTLLKTLIEDLDDPTIIFNQK